MIDKQGEQSMTFGTHYNLKPGTDPKAPTNGAPSADECKDNLDRNIWKIGRAKTAALPYFELIRSGRFRHAKFLDGGFPRYNNPTQMGYHCIRKMKGNKPKMTFTLFSIDAGKKKAQQRNAGWVKGPLEIYALVQISLQFATDGEPTHETIADLISHPSGYFRLSVGKGIGDMVLDDWRGQNGRDALNQLKEATERFLDCPSTKVSITEIAESLVRARRARANDGNSGRWERYCYGIHYQCEEDDCDKDTIRYTLIDFHNHLKLAHNSQKRRYRKG